MSHQYLAIDLGAESGRAMLADLSGHLLKLQEVHRFPNIPVTLPTGLYWNTLGLFQEILQGLRAAARLTGRLESVAIDTWGVDFGLVGADGALIDNPRHYRDARTAGLPEKMFAVVPRAEIFAATGVQFMELNSLYQLWAVHRQAPWLLARRARCCSCPTCSIIFCAGRWRRSAPSPARHNSTIRRTRSLPPNCWRNWAYRPACRPNWWTPAAIGRGASRAGGRLRSGARYPGVYHRQPRYGLGGGGGAGEERRRMVLYQLGHVVA